MAFILADRVEQVTRTTGTSDLVLAETPSGRQSFSDVAGMGDTMLYVLEDGNGSDWEIGLGTLSIGAEVVVERTTVRQSSNADAKISLTSAAHRVYLVADAALLDDFARESTANTFTETQQVSGDANDYLEVKSTDDADKPFLRILDSNDNVVGRLRVLNMDGVGAGDLDIDLFDAINFAVEPSVGGSFVLARTDQANTFTQAQRLSGGTGVYAEVKSTDDLDKVFLRVLDSGDNVIGRLLMRGLDGVGAGTLDIDTFDSIEVAPDTDFLNALTVAGEIVYHESNILGTVSQSGGTPTGAIIERGSNANGEYTRFADGTQIVTVDEILLSFVGSGTLATTWTFPAAFSVIPSIDHMVLLDGTNTLTASELENSQEKLNSRASTDVSLQVRDSSDPYVSGDEVTVSAIAIGHWF